MDALTAKFCEARERRLVAYTAYKETVPHRDGETPPWHQGDQALLERLTARQTEERTMQALVWPGLQQAVEIATDAVKALPGGSNWLNNFAVSFTNEKLQEMDNLIAAWRMLEAARAAYANAAATAFAAWNPTQAKGPAR